MFERRIQIFRSGLLAVSLVMGAVSAAPAQTNPADAQVQADVMKALNNKRFQNVKVTVHDGVATLTGTVPLYADKEDADKKVHHRKNVKAVQNMIEVAGPRVEDAQLRNTLARKLVYDRVGYGTTAFNSLSVDVRNGVVTLSGTMYGPVDKDSALSVVANTPGVRDVIDNVQVAPVSPMDDRLRIALARAIYGAPQLNRYAMDPAKPIRITVINGNVTLTGVVDSQADKDVANIRANGVPGVFKVTNDLQVAGSSSQAR